VLRLTAWEGLTRRQIGLLEVRASAAASAFVRRFGRLYATPEARPDDLGGDRGCVPELGR
jgi:hypothetical protein